MNSGTPTDRSVTSAVLVAPNHGETKIRCVCYGPGSYHGPECAAQLPLGRCCAACAERVPATVAAVRALSYASGATKRCIDAREHDWVRRGLALELEDSYRDPWRIECATCGYAATRGTCTANKYSTVLRRHPGGIWECMEWRRRTPGRELAGDDLLRCQAIGLPPR